MTRPVVTFDRTTKPINILLRGFSIGSVFGLATGDHGLLYATFGTNVYNVNMVMGLATFKRNYTSLGRAYAIAWWQCKTSPTFYANRFGQPAVPAFIPVLRRDGPKSKPIS